MRFIVFALLVACDGDVTPPAAPATGPATAFFLGQFDQIATTLDDMEVDVVEASDLELVALTVLNRTGAADSVRVMGSIANRGDDNLCGIDIDYALLGEGGRTLLDTSSSVAGSTLANRSGNVNRSSCLRPGERGAFFDIESFALDSAPLEVTVRITGDTGYEEPAQQVVGTVVSVDQTGSDDGRVEVELENTGTTDAYDVDAQIFARSASGTYTDWVLQSDIGRLDAGATTTVIFADVKIPVDGTVELYVDWDAL